MIRNFLKAPELETFRRDFAGGAEPETYPFGFKPVGRRALAAFLPKAEEVLKVVRKATSLQVDSINFLTLSHYVVTRLAQRTSTVHQDYDLDYRLSGDHLHYLNFWIPIEKPQAEKSNLCLLPLDTLKAKDPEAFRRTVGAGGRRWLTEQGRTAVYGSSEEAALLEEPQQPLFTLDWDVEDFLETPVTRAGDLLLLRGDLPHRTQDRDTVRVAASLRATRSDKMLPRSRAQYRPEEPAAGLLRTLEECYQHHDLSEVSVGQFVDFAQGRRR